MAKKNQDTGLVGEVTALEQAEIDALAEANDGVVTPAMVVEASRDPSSALHNRFLWGRDDEAARRWRLIQARGVIRAQVTIIENSRGERTVVARYCSLHSDRAGEGGYRQTVHVMGDAGMREELLANAREDFMAFQRRYDTLRELAALFAEADKVFRRSPKKKSIRKKRSRSKAPA